MLILSRKIDDVIVLDVRGVRIEIMVTAIERTVGNVQIGIKAPTEVAIIRKELERRTGFSKVQSETPPAGIPREHVEQIRKLAEGVRSCDCFECESALDDLKVAIDATLAATR